MKKEEVDIPIELEEKIKALPVEKKREVLELLAEKKRRTEEEQYRYFIPNGLQEKFIKLVGADEVFICLLIAGNNVGKSAILANILANICFEPLNEWFRLPLFEKFRYIRDIRVASDPTTIISKTIPEMKKWFPRGRYSSTKAGKMFESQWQTVTGFHIDLLTYEQQVKEFESVDRGLIIFDEPPPQGVFKASVARMRKGGVIIIAFTPTLESNSEWIKDDLIDKGDLSLAKYVGWINGGMEENCRQHGVRGQLEHHEIEKILATYNRFDLQAREKGQFVHLIGRIFKDSELQDNIQFIKPFAIPDEWNKFRAIDWGFNNPTACVWLAIDTDDNWYIYDEHEQEDLSVQEQKGVIKVKTGQDKIRYTLIDPSTERDIGDGAKTIRKQFSDFDEISQYQIPTILARNEKGAVWGGIMKMKELLAPHPKTGIPRLRIFNTCVKLRYELSHYITHTVKVAIDKDPREEPRKKKDHLVDALRYIALRNPQYFNGQESSENYEGDNRTGY